MITAKYILDNIGKSSVKIYPNEVTNVTYKELVKGRPTINYISLDGLGVDLYDDTSEFASDYDYLGYISEDVSDSDGNSNDFVAVYGYIPDDMSTAQNNLDLTHGITINFDKDYVKEILVVAYNVEDNEVYKNSFIIDKLNNYLEIEPIICNRVYIYFTKTNTPNSFVKINTLILGEIHIIDEFSKFELLDEKNLLSSDLPIGQVTFSTISEKDLIGKEGNLVILYDGTQLLGDYYLKEIGKENKAKYSFIIQNILYKLENNYDNQFAVTDYIWKYKKVNAYDELVKLFNFVGVDYYIDESIKNIWLSPYMETGKTARYVLQQICFACGAYVDCWMTDKIKVLVDKPSEISKTITDLDDVILETKIESGNPASNVVWKIKSVEAKNIEQNPEIIAQVPVSEFNTTRYNFEKEVYATSADLLQGNGLEILEITPQYIVMSTRTEGVAAVYGYPLVKSDINKSIYLRDYGKEASLSQYNLIGFKSNDGNLYVDDDIETLNNIENYYTKFTGKTLSAKIAYRGEKTGDLISIQTNDGSMFTGIINSLSFNNISNYRTAKIEVIEWNI